MFSSLGCFAVEDGKLGRRGSLAAFSLGAGPGSLAVVIA